MHIADGVLSIEALAGGSLAALVGVAIGLRSIDYERIPRVAVMSSAFFVSSLIHVPLPPSSVHLVLNGLVGIMLGWAAFPAILIGLFLQALFFGHGGFTTLGVNTLNMALPAVVCYYLFRPARLIGAPKLPGDGVMVFITGFSAGVAAIALATGLWVAALMASGGEFVLLVKTGAMMAIPISVVEGLVTGFAALFVARVRPELLRHAHGVKSEKEVLNASE